MAQFYDVDVRFKNGQTAKGRAIGNNAAWKCICGEILLGPHEAMYPIPPCPKCGRAFCIHQGNDPQFVALVEEV